MKRKKGSDSEKISWLFKEKKLKKNMKKEAASELIIFVMP